MPCDVMSCNATEPNLGREHQPRAAARRAPAAEAARLEVFRLVLVGLGAQRQSRLLGDRGHVTVTLSGSETRSLPTADSS